MSPRPDFADAGFEPSGERGRGLDLGMRTRLAQSVGYVFDSIGRDLGITANDSGRAVEAIRARRQSPQLFGAYYDLVLAVERDEIAEARGFAREIIERLDTPSPRAWVASLASRSASDEDRGFPEMAAEIRELLFEVVVAAGPIEPGMMTFDGSSSYMLWGAIMLNATGQSSVLETAQALAHESGHNLLFGQCVNGPLVENGSEESFAHPLRQDPRPMDGVFHAAYVIARMHQTVERLLESGVLDEEQTEAARKDLGLLRRNFEEADSVVRSGGRLTPLGRHAIEAARVHLSVPA